MQLWILQGVYSHKDRLLQLLSANANFAMLENFGEVLVERAQLQLAERQIPSHPQQCCDQYFINLL